MTPQARRRRDLSFLEQLDRQAELDFAHDEGLEQGLEQGLAQGLEQGLEQGMAQGRFQAQKETALKMLSNGLSPELIAEVTGLDPETIKDL